MPCWGSWAVSAVPELVGSAGAQLVGSVVPELMGDGAYGVCGDGARGQCRAKALEVGEEGPCGQCCTVLEFASSSM